MASAIRRSRSAEPSTSRTQAHPWTNLPQPTQPTPLAHIFELRVERQGELSGSDTSPAPARQTAQERPYTAISTNPVLPPNTVLRLPIVEAPVASPSGSHRAETLGATTAPGYNTPPTEPSHRDTRIRRPTSDDFLEQFRAVQEFNNHNRTLRRERARVRDERPFNPHFLRHHLPLSSAMSSSARPTDIVATPTLPATTDPISVLAEAVRLGQEIRD